MRLCYGLPLPYCTIRHPTGGNPDWRVEPVSAAAFTPTRVPGKGAERDIGAGRYSLVSFG